MNRSVWIATLWALGTLVAFKSDTVVNAIEVKQERDTDKLNKLLQQHKNNTFALVHDSQVMNSHHFENTNNSPNETDGETKHEGQSTDANVNTDVDTEAIRKKLRKNRITDILVACFFFIAAVWLVIATGYSVILLVLLRLQARDELDIYDENLGRLALCNGRITLHFGWLLRRYAVQLEEDYQRQVRQSFGDEENQDAQRIRIMTREERRKAVEELLGDSAITLDIESGNYSHRRNDKEKCCTPVKKVAASKKPSAPSSPNTSLCSDEGPVCSICLVEYEATDLVFKSKSCPHIFHGDCLFSWLERRNNTECPCCRVPLVSDDDVWEVVQRLRKERRKEIRRENGFLTRFLRWTESRKQPQAGVTSVESDRTDTSASLSSGSNVDEESSSTSSTESQAEVISSDNTDDQQGSSSSSAGLSPDDVGIDDIDEPQESSPSLTELYSDDISDESGDDQQDSSEESKPVNIDGNDDDDVNDDQEVSPSEDNS